MPKIKNSLFAVVQEAPAIAIRTPVHVTCIGRKMLQIVGYDEASVICQRYTDSDFTNDDMLLMNFIADAINRAAK